MSGRPQSGFTVVELLIVIVVIGILAAIVVSTYTSAQANARDTRRKNDLAQIRKSLIAYGTEKGDLIGLGSGCGYLGDGSGWFYYENGLSNGYPKSIRRCITEAGFMPENIRDPSGTTTCAANTVCRTYMKYTCTDGSAYVYASLETLPTSSSATDATCATSIDGTYGMNFYLHIPKP